MAINGRIQQAREVVHLDAQQLLAPTADLSGLTDPERHVKRVAVQDVRHLLHATLGLFPIGEFLAAFS